MNPIRNRISNGASPDGRTRKPRNQNDQAAEIIAHTAAQFIKREAGSESLITVIRAQSLAHGDRVIVFVSVFPVEKTRAALAFLERQREAFSDYLKQHAHLRLPHIDFQLDNGEAMGELPKN